MPTTLHFAGRTPHLARLPILEERQLTIFPTIELGNTQS